MTNPVVWECFICMVFCFVFVLMCVGGMWCVSACVHMLCVCVCVKCMYVCAAGQQISRMAMAFGVLEVDFTVSYWSYNNYDTWDYAFQEVKRMADYHS